MQDDPISRFFVDLLTVLQSEHPRLHWRIDGDDNLQAATITATTRTVPELRFAMRLDYQSFLQWPGRSTAAEVISNSFRYEIGNAIGNYFMGKDDKR